MYIHAAALPSPHEAPSFAAPPSRFNARSASEVPKQRRDATDTRRSPGNSTKPLKISIYSELSHENGDFP